MKPVKPVTRYITGLARGAVIFSLMLLCSCALVSQTFTPPGPRNAFSEAEQLFLAGKYREALHAFQQDYDDPSRDAGERSLAMYGLACAHIVLARTDRELAEGIDDLKKWDEEKEIEHHTENPRLLILAVREQGEALTKRNREQQRQMSGKDRIIAGQKEKIAELSDIIEALRKQLDELEAIDETFQEKRKAL